MRRVVSRPKRRMTRVGAFAIALLCFVFLLQLAPHGHASGADEAACLICQAAHVGATPVVSAIVLTVPLFPVGEVSLPYVGTGCDSFFHHSDPRAPPEEI
jgi:hypothetical protein